MLQSPKPKIPRPRWEERNDAGKLTSDLCELIHAYPINKYIVHRKHPLNCEMALCYTAALSMAAVFHLAHPGSSWGFRVTKACALLAFPSHSAWTPGPTLLLFVLHWLLCRSLWKTGILACLSDATGAHILLLTLEAQSHQPTLGLEPRRTMPSLSLAMISGFLPICGNSPAS